MMSVKQGGIKYHFLIFGMTQPAIEPQANTLPSRPMGRFYTYKQFYFKQFSLVLFDP